MRQIAWNIRGGCVCVGVQIESCIARQVWKPFPPRRVAGQKRLLVSRWAGGHEWGPPSHCRAAGVRLVAGPARYQEEPEIWIFM